MPVMHVGEMCVRMRDRKVNMGVRVRLVAGPGKVVLVPMMRVMHMPMRMLEPLVRMLVLVPLAHVQPYAEHHQRGGDPERRAGRLRPYRERKRDAEHRRDRKVRAGARGPEMPQRLPTTSRGTLAIFGSGEAARRGSGGWICSVEPGQRLRRRRA